MSIEEKAISIKGKKYILVKDRVLEFNDKFPKGCITTEIIQYPDGQMITDKTVVVKASVYPDGTQAGARYFTGHSQATIGGAGVNREAALENAETSAIGRALGLLGIGIIDSIASVDEMVKAGVIKAQEMD